MRAALAALLLAGLTVWAWRGLWVEAPTGRLVLVAFLGAVPAVTITIDRGVRARVGLVVSWILAAVMVLGLATDVSIQSLLRLRGSAWDAVVDLIDQGFSAAATITIPLAGDEIRSTTALLLIVIATTVSAVVALVFAARRPLPAVLGAIVAIAYRWTLVPPERPHVEALVVVAVALLVIALVRGGRRPGSHPVRTAVTGAAVVGVAALGGLGMWGSGAWWDWQNWSWGRDDPQTTVLSTAQSYGPLRYGDEPVEVMRVRTPRVASLRAVTLTRFDGLSFVEDMEPLRRSMRVDGGQANVYANFGATRDAGEEVQQQIHLTGTRTPWLYTAGNTRAVAGLDGREARLFTDGSIKVAPEMERGSSYRFASTFVDPGPQALLQSGPYEPADVDDDLLQIDPGRGLPTVDVPLFGSGGVAPDPEAFGDYAEVYRLSRRIVGDSKTPYEAVNRIERYLRAAPFTYDTEVERPVGRPDLAVFLLETRRGYCQQFAGAMGLMLRMNGIPTRVAVGFNVPSGRYDAVTRTFQVVDRDAHSWVEVAFPGYGWLPFDPTPSRYASNSASVSAPDYAPPAVLDDPTVDLAPAPVDPAPQTPVPIPAPTPDPAPAPETTTDGTDRTLVGVLIGLPVLLLISPLAVKSVRRRLRRRGDGRAQVLGAVRELESLMTDLGRPPDPAASGRERSAVARRDLGIDAERIYRLAGAARFGVDQPGSRAAREAWDDVRRARRGLPLRTRLAADLRPASLRRPRR